MYFFNFGKLRNKLVTDTIWGVSYMVTIALSGLFIQTHISNKLDSAALGIFNKSTSIFMIFCTICGFSLPEAIVRFSALNKDRQDQLSGYLKAGTAAVFLISLCVLIFIFMGLNFYDFHANKNFIRFLEIQLLSLPIFVANKVMLAALNGLRKMKYFSLIQILRWAFLAILISFFISLTGEITSAAYSFMVTEIIVFASCLLAHRQIISQPAKSLNEIVLKVKEVATYSTPLALGSVTFEVGSNADIFILALFCSNSQIGVYSVALYVINGFLLLPSILQVNFNPVIVNTANAENPHPFRQMLFKARNLNIILMGLMAAAFCVLFPMYIRFFMHKPEFNKSIEIFYILMIGIFPGSVFLFLGSLFSMSGYPRIQLFLAMSQFILKLTLLFLFTKYFNITGSAVAIVLTQLIGLSMFAYAVRSKFKTNIFKI